MFPRTARQVRRTRSLIDPLEPRTLMAAGFQIDFAVTAGTVPTQLMTALQAAANKWQTIITGDAPDSNQPGVGPVDDIRVDVEVTGIDEAGGQTNLAEPLVFNTAANGSLPVLGLFRFDEADLTNLMATSTFNTLLTRGLGKILGIGYLGPTVLNAGDPFTGARTEAEYRANSRVPAGTGVPTAPDVVNGYLWSEAAFGNEVMTPTLSVNAPISRMTVAALADIGYTVNFDAADPYVPTGGNTPPVLSGFGVSPSSVPAGDPVSVTLTSATDSDGLSSNPRFYVESNGLPGLQPGTGAGSDSLIFNSLSASASFNYTMPLSQPRGTLTFYAQAIDAYGAVTTQTQDIFVDFPTPPPKPTKMFLIASSDTGDSSTDGVTRFNGSAGKPLSFEVDGVLSGATAEVGYFVNNGTFQTFTPVGSVVVPGGATSVIVNLPTQPDGTRTYFARQTVAVRGPSSATSLGESVRIDTVAPTFGTPTYDREVSQDVTIAVTNGDDVTSNLAGSDVNFNNVTDPNNIQYGHAAGVQSIFQLFQPWRVVINVNATPLANGRYLVFIPREKLTDVAGNVPTDNFNFTFSQLNGDANNDGVVNFDDLLVLAQNYNKTNKTFSQANFDYSAGGEVSFDDLLILAQNYNKSLPPATAASVATEPQKKTESAGRAVALIGL